MNDSPDGFERAVEAPCKSRWHTVSGRRIHSLAWGAEDRPGVVLVHGGAAHARWWVPIAPDLASEFHVVALDLSGHGDSGWRDRYSLDLWAAEVSAVVEGASFSDKPVLVGHSMGGYVGACVAGDPGLGLAGTILLDAPVFAPDSEVDDRVMRIPMGNEPQFYEHEASALARYRLHPEQPWVEPVINRYVARTSLREEAGRWSWKFDPRVFDGVLTRRALRDGLAKMLGRVAIVRAERGEVTQEIGAYMSGLLAGRASVVEVPMAYHHLMLDQPRVLLQVLRRILADWAHGGTVASGPGPGQSEEAGAGRDDA